VAFDDLVSHEADVRRRPAKGEQSELEEQHGDACESAHEPPA
jgi:hypothetical protein